MSSFFESCAIKAIVIIKQILSYKIFNQISIYYHCTINIDFNQSHFENKSKNCYYIRFIFSYLFKSYNLIRYSLPVISLFYFISVMLVIAVDYFSDEVLCVLSVFDYCGESYNRIFSRSKSDNCRTCSFA